MRLRTAGSERRFVGPVEDALSVGGFSTLLGLPTEALALGEGRIRRRRRLRLRCVAIGSRAPREGRHDHDPAVRNAIRIARPPIVVLTDTLPAACRTHMRPRARRWDDSLRT